MEDGDNSSLFLKIANDWAHEYLQDGVCKLDLVSGLFVVGRPPVLRKGPGMEDGGAAPEDVARVSSWFPH